MKVRKIGEQRMRAGGLDFQSLTLMMRMFGSRVR